MKKKTFVRILLVATAVCATVIGLLLAGANRILKYELENRLLGRGFSVGAVDLRWGALPLKR